MSIPLDSLLTECRRLLDQRDAILERCDSHADLVDSLSSRLEEAERDLRGSLECKSDMEETLAEMREELESRPDAVGQGVREILDLLREVIEDTEGEADEY
jgi:chromosome segregation ATPase